MPPKEDNSAAPAAAAVVEGTGEAPTTNATATASDGRRRDREEPAEEQRVVRARQEVLEVRKWEWSSPVSDILLHRINPVVEKMGLREFVREYVRRDYPIEQIDDYTMDVVVEELEECVTDGELRRRIEGREAFQQLRNTRQARQQAMKDADILEERGVDTLRQWRDFGDKGIVSPRSRGILDGVEVQDTEIPQGGQVLAGLYESIYDAKWDYVVKSLNGVPDRFWMEVKKGNFPPSLEWTDGEVDFFTPVEEDEEVPWDLFEARRTEEEKVRKKELLEDKNNVKPTQERLMMKVLTSPKKWPYGLQRRKPIFDCFVTREVERAWRVVRDDMRHWVIGELPLLVERRQRVLIGTPGIGKSMGAGSYLLYQLLQYDTRILPVVAYFIGDETYIFDKNTRQVTMFNDVLGLSEVKRLADSKNGYTIYDCSKKTGEPPLGLPQSWGTVVISSPNENNFKDWAKQKPASNFIINCPEESDIKAMCVWMKRDKPEDIHKYWSKIRERMLNVGPIPRFIFDYKYYNNRLRLVNKTTSKITVKEAEEYYDAKNEELWISDKAPHKIVKIVRVAFDDGGEMFYNEPVCLIVRDEILKRVGPAIDTSAILMAILLPLDVMIPRVLEKLGVQAFMNQNFIGRACKNIIALPPPPPRQPRRCVFQQNALAYPTDSKGIPTVDGVNNNKMKIDAVVLYRGNTNFPVVDGFFFVYNPRKTIVGIQTTVRRDHDTTTSKVMALRERLRDIFEGWDDFSTDLTWEIIYVQHKDSETMTRWQKCDNPFQEGKSYESRMDTELKKALKKKKKELEALKKKMSKEEPKAMEERSGEEPEDTEEISKEEFEYIKKTMSEQELKDMKEKIINEHEAIAKHWNEEVYQYHLKISSDDVGGNKR